MTEDRFAMVSEWMANGNINHFVEASRDANRFELVNPSLWFLWISLIADNYAAV